MRVIILAAGEGQRLRPHTLERPKCLVELAGKALLEYQIDTLKSFGMDSITLCTGYRADMLESLGLPTRHNPDYAKTNMVASLMGARDLFDGEQDILVTYGDIIYQTEALQSLVDCPADFAISVNTEWLELWQARHEDPLSDAETLKISDDGAVLSLGKRPKSLDEVEAQYMGLILIRKTLAPTVVQFHDSLDILGPYDGKDRDNMYMTSLLQALIDQGHRLEAVKVAGGWLEVDECSDLELYESMHQAGKLGRFCQLNS